MAGPFTLSVRSSDPFFCPFVCWFFLSVHWVIRSFPPLLLHLYTIHFKSKLLGLQTHPNRHQAPHKHYNTEYNIIRGSDPECKEVQGLVTEVVSAGVSVVWLVDFVNPHISKNEPDKEKDLYNSLQRVYASLFLVAVSISDTTSAAVGKDSCRSSHDQVNGNHVFHRTLIFVFGIFYEDIIECFVGKTVVCSVPDWYKAVMKCEIQLWKNGRPMCNIEAIPVY